MSAII